MNGIYRSRHRGRGVRRMIAMALAWPLAYSLISLGPLAAAAEEVPATWYADASLNRVYFLDDLEGLAIGDRGVIWRTGNGGRSWEQYPSGTSAQLRDITFVNDQTGYIVGGDIQPYSQQSTGVVLKTTDAGHTWRVLPMQSLPLLKAVRFETADRGYALAEPNSLYPSGLLETIDGGRSWRPLPHVQPRAYQALEILSPGEMMLAGERTSIALVDRGGIRKPGYQEDPLRTIHAIASLDRNRLLAVGDGGLVLQSADRGGSWQPLEIHSSARVQRQIDLRAIAAQGQNVWIAGDPGGLILHSADGGETWKRQKSPTSLPIHSLHFINDQTGYACGALGTILGTTDGGQNWKLLQGTHQRVALWGLFHRPEAIPWEMLSYYGGGQGYLSAVEVLNRYDRPSQAGMAQGRGGRSARSIADAPVHAASLLTGGSLGSQGWRFPMDSPELHLEGQRLVSGWNAAYDGQGVSEVQRHLVRRIRQWRPSVVVTDYADPRGGSPLPYLTNQLVISALEKAADPEEYPEQISELGLSPWRVSKAFSAVPADHRGSISLNCTQVSSTLGMSISEHAAPARGMIDGRADAGPLVLEFNLLRSLATEDSAGRDLFFGLSHPAGRNGRRAEEPVPLVDLAALQRIAQKRRNLDGIVQSVSAKSVGHSAALGQVLKIAEELPENRGAEVLSQAAAKLIAGGQTAMAADLHRQLIDHFPESPLASLSAKWLIRYYASRECRQRYLAEGNSGMTAEAELLTQQSVARMEDEGSSVRPANFESQTHSNQTSSAANRGMAVVKQAQRHWPWLLSDPDLAFSLERLHTEVGQGRQAESFLARIIAQGEGAPWYEKVQAEMIIHRGQGRHDLPVASCGKADSPPRLDGRLDDPIWRSVRPIDLKAAANAGDESWPAAAFFCYDQEYLYLAIRCRNAPDSKYLPPLEEPRTRDADLSQNDRVTIRLDIDRDHGTWYELSVDYLGQTAESCFGDPTWDPTWYVAAHQEGGVWTVEAAIRLADLVAEPPAAGTQWALSVDRIAVGTGLQSWTQPPTLKPNPEKFGLLWFK